VKRDARGQLSSVGLCDVWPEEKHKLSFRWKNTIRDYSSLGVNRGMKRQLMIVGLEICPVRALRRLGRIGARGGMEDQGSCMQFY